MIVLAVKQILNSQERILFELQQKMAALLECSWQWMPIAAKKTCGCSTTVAHKIILEDGYIVSCSYVQPLASIKHL